MYRAPPRSGRTCSARHWAFIATLSSRPKTTLFACRPCLVVQQDRVAVRRDRIQRRRHRGRPGGDPTLPGIGRGGSAIRRTTAANWASARTIWPWSWSGPGRPTRRGGPIRKPSAFRKAPWDSDEDSGQGLVDLARAHSNLGLLQNATGDAEGAAASIARAVELQEQLLSARPDDPERLCDLAVTLNHRGALYAERQPAKSIEPYERAAAMQRKAVELRPDEFVYRNELALTYNNLGAAQSRSKAVAQAAESYAKVVDLASELVQQSPAQKPYRRTLALGYNNLGLAQSKLGHATAAEASYRYALAILETLVKQDPQNVDLQSDLGGMYNNLGLVLEEMHRPADAVKAYQEAIAHQQQAVASAPAISKYREFLSKHYVNYDRVMRKSGHPGNAARTALANH